MQSTSRNSVTLVLGGVRSGKSRYAQQLGERLQRVVFVATGAAGDEEMRLKIERHRNSRPSHWQTIEEPLHLAELIHAHGPGSDLIIIDCLTFFATNLLHAYGDDAVANEVAITHAVDSLCRALSCASCPVVLVSNEVGSGVVPPYPLGRRFRDLLGEINQQVAGVAGNVLLLIAGLPLVLKGERQPELIS